MSLNPIREFILGLLHDRRAAAAYRADPDRALHAAGLAALTPQDIAAMAAMVTESALIPGGELLAAVLAANGDPADDAGHEGDPQASDIRSGTADAWSSADIARAFEY